MVDLADIRNVENYRIYTMVDENYDNLPINLIDFKRHLQPPKTLNKVVQKGADGRPIIAEYFYGDATNPDNLMAKIYYLFKNFDGSPLMCRRAEVLNYINLDGEESPDIYIKDKKYDINNPTDLETIIAEREKARLAILSSIKGALVGIIQANAPELNTDEISALVSPFWAEYANERQSFLDLGTDDFRDSIEEIDLGTTVHSWLGMFAAPSYTIQDYLVDQLTYTTVDNHNTKEFIDP